MHHYILSRSVQYNDISIVLLFFVLENVTYGHGPDPASAIQYSVFTPMSDEIIDVNWFQQARRLGTFTMANGICQRSNDERAIFGVHQILQVILKIHTYEREKVRKNEGIIVND